MLRTLMNTWGFTPIGGHTMWYQAFTEDEPELVKGRQVMPTRVPHITMMWRHRDDGLVFVHSSRWAMMPDFAEVQRLVMDYTPALINPTLKVTLAGRFMHTFDNPPYPGAKPLESQIPALPEDRIMQDANWTSFYVEPDRLEDLFSEWVPIEVASKEYTVG